MQSDPVERAYEPPGSIARQHAPRAEPPGLDLRLVRLHLVLLAVAVVTLAVVTAGMQLELWDPAPSLAPKLYDRCFTIHAIAPLTVLLPVGMCVLPLLVLPSAFGMRYPAWVAWPALVMWSVGVFPWWVWIVPPANSTLRLVLGLSFAGAGCLHALGLVVAVIGSGRATLGRVPVVAMGLVLGGVGSVLLIVLGLVLPALGPVGLVAPRPVDALLPVLVVMAVGIVERRRGITLWSRRLAVALAMVLLGTWGTYAGSLAIPSELGAIAYSSSALLLPLVLYVLTRIARFALGVATDPVGLAVLLALAATGVAATAESLSKSLSVDVHLHDTVFATVPMHLVGAAVLLLLVAACLHGSSALFGREPRRKLALTGVLGLGGGLLVSFVLMAVLGQRGMPRRYVAYVPQFQSLQQWIGVGSLVAAVGLVLVCLAFVTGRRAAATAQPEGSAGV